MKMKLLEILDLTLGNDFFVLCLLATLFFSGLLVIISPVIIDWIDDAVFYNWKPGSNLRHWWLYREKWWGLSYWYQQKPTWLYPLPTRPLLWKLDRCKEFRRRGISWRKAWDEANRSYIKLEEEVRLYPFRASHLD